MLMIAALVFGLLGSYYFISMFPPLFMAAIGIFIIFPMLVVQRIYEACSKK